MTTAPPLRTTSTAHPTPGKHTPPHLRQAAAGSGNETHRRELVRGQFAS